MPVRGGEKTPGDTTAIICVTKIRKGDSFFKNKGEHPEKTAFPQKYLN
jgi:hypothetical protein